MKKKPKDASGNRIPLFSDDEARAARVLYKAGYSFEQVAALLGITIGVAEEHVRKELP